MKLTVERDHLVATLARAQGVVERKTTIAITGNVKLAAADNALTVAATDLDIEADATCAATIDRPGTITVPAGRLYDIARNLPSGGQITLNHDASDPRMRLSCGRSTYQLPTLPPSDWPHIPRDARKGGNIDAAALLRLLDQTAHAQSTEETRYYLNGVYLHVASHAGLNYLRSAATDGYRAVVAEMPMPEDFADWPGIIVPRKAVGEMRRMLGDAKGEVGLRASTSKLVLELGSGASMVTKLVDGKFPDYQRILPTNNPHLVSVDIDLLSRAVARAAIIADGKSRLLRCNLEPGVMRLTARGEDTSHGAEEFEADYEGPALEFGFNVRFLTDQLTRAGGENIALHIAGPQDPILLLDPTDPATRAVIMPTRA